MVESGKKMSRGGQRKRESSQCRKQTSSNYWVEQVADEVEKVNTNDEGGVGGGDRRKMKFTRSGGGLPISHEIAAAAKTGNKSLYETSYGF